MKALAQQPAAGARAGRGAEAAAELARRQVRAPRELANRERVAEALERPLHRAGDRIVIDAPRDGRLYELRLPAVTVRGDDHLPSDAVGDLGSMVAADEVQTQVDPAAVPAEVSTSPPST